jgi:glutamate-1-semialdehyde aminotransferase
VRGRSSLMRQYSTHPDGTVAWTGTYNGQLGSVVAALHTIATLVDGGLTHINGLGERMRAGLREIVAEAGAEDRWTVVGYGSIYTLVPVRVPVAGRLRTYRDRAGYLRSPASMAAAAAPSARHIRPPTSIQR